MNTQTIKNALKDLRVEARKNARYREIVRYSRTTRMWFKGNSLVDLEIEVAKGVLI